MIKRCDKGAYDDERNVLGNINTVHSWQNRDNSTSLTAVVRVMHSVPGTGLGQCGLRKIPDS